MNIHEYQAKEILKSFGVTVPKGYLAHTADEAVQQAKELGGDVCVVKAQIHAGGRGKAGGVRICKSPDEVKTAANGLLGSVLVTKQTGEAGKEVGKVYIEEGLDIAREFYLSLLVDREEECVSFVVSPAGGMDIEEVAATQPEKIATFPVRDINICDTTKMASFLGLNGDAVTKFDDLAKKLYQIFMDSDAAMLELNPLVLTGAGDLVALDAKFVADDNALYRQEAIVAMRDLSEEDSREIEAAQFGLNYIQLDGNIGCMVNGAGLAMATMDMIHMKGEEPANFLDVGGGVTIPAVTEAFKLLFSDKHVKAVLVNIFGGIVRCDIIAQGLLEAIKTHPMNVPVVMRLVGTNEEAGQKLIKDAALDVYWADDLDEAASIAVKVIS
ncbi:MAG: ADP-forming succinate--CoA ligase subunit beta [Mariprofundaceae bacterium]|nr:ADP-forming succinate--CoA ligase subunit beta [Mariprofundaceae bacterium]